MNNVLHLSCLENKMSRQIANVIFFTFPLLSRIVCKLWRVVPKVNCKIVLPWPPVVKHHFSKYLTEREKKKAKGFFARLTCLLKSTKSAFDVSREICAGILTLFAGCKITITFATRKSEMFLLNIDRPVVLDVLNPKETDLIV